MLLPCVSVLKLAEFVIRVSQGQGQREVKCLRALLLRGEAYTQRRLGVKVCSSVQGDLK